MANIIGVNKYTNLFEPIKLGGTYFRNRIFAAPTGFQDMDRNGIMPPEAAFYYERKAKGGAASVTVGECVVDSAYGKGADLHICLDDSFSKSGLSRITGAVNRYGAVCSAELQHGGMYANRSMHPMSDIAYGPVECEVDGMHVLPMTEEVIEYIIDKYAKAAAFAKSCGFGMVTVHAGHGWLLHQFLSPSLNTRKDKWGGSSIENRARLTVAVCDAIRKATGPKFPIEIRISGSECYEEGYDIEEGVAIAKQLDGHVNLIHVSAGSHEVEKVFTVTHPSLFLPDGVNVKYAAEVKKHVDTPVATVGALGDPELMEEIIASGKADVVEIARGLLADPDLPLKIRTGKEKEIRKCMRCLACFSELINTGHFYCAINPEIGHEIEFKLMPPPVDKKKVLVVGGGIAGMQAAITAEKRGHEVILCEKTSRLGGVLLCEENVSFKVKLGEYIEYQENLIKNSSIDLRLNTEVTKEYADSIEANVIIAALGSKPIVPNITGIDGDNVFSPNEAYDNPEQLGDTVAVLGAGLVGTELAIHLAMLGKKVSIIEMLDKINDGGNIQHLKAIKVELDKYGIDVNFSTVAKEITNKGVKCSSENNELIVNADSVIYAVGQAPLTEEMTVLRSSAPEFYEIGDCVVPKNIMTATSTANEIAKYCGRL